MRILWGKTKRESAGEGLNAYDCWTHGGAGGEENGGLTLLFILGGRKKRTKPRNHKELNLTEEATCVKENEEAQHASVNVV